MKNYEISLIKNTDLYNLALDIDVSKGNGDKRISAQENIFLQEQAQFLVEAGKCSKSDLEQISSYFGLDTSTDIQQAKLSRMDQQLQVKKAELENLRLKLSELTEKSIEEFRVKRGKKFTGVSAILGGAGALAGCIVKGYGLKMVGMLIAPQAGLMVTAGMLVAGAVGHGVYKVVDHFQQSNRDKKIENLTQQIQQLESEIQKLEP